MVALDIIVSIIGGAFLVLVTIIGYFVRKFINTTEKNEERACGLMDKTNENLNNLTEATLKMNGNLEAYQLSMKEKVDGIKEKIEIHKNIYIKDKKDIDEKLEEHETSIQDLTIRTVLNEREVQKINKTIDNIQINK